MEKIEFYYLGNNRPRAIDVELDLLRPLSKYYSPQDLQNIEKNWEERKKQGLFSKELGTLLDVIERHDKLDFVYGLTEYKEYNAICCPALEEIQFSQNIKDKMRVSSVGVAITTADKKVLIQRRQKNLMAGGLLDSGAAGFCPVEKGLLNFEKSAKEKLERELSLKDKDLISLCHSSIFSSRGFCFSGMFGYTGEIRLNFSDIKKGLNKRYAEDLIGIDKKDLADFLHQSYIKNEMIGDGLAVLMGVLSDKERFDLIYKINRNEQIICFGRLLDGKFTSVWPI